MIALNNVWRSIDIEDNSLSVFRGLERPWQVEAH